MKRLSVSLALFLALVVVFTAMSAWLRLYRIGEFNLHQDEFYQFETAVGYLKTGEYARWDFYRDDTDQAYDRATIYIQQVVQSLRWFGINEASARYPAALWGILLIPLTALLLWYITQDKVISAGVAGILTFDWFMIDMSRYNRMYTMVFVLTILTIAAWYRFFTTQRQIERIAAGVIVVMSLVAYWLAFKQLAIALVGALAGYTALRGFIAIVRKRHHSPELGEQEQWWRYGLVAGVAGLIVAAIIQVTVIAWFPLSAFTIRKHPQWSYVLELFTEWRSYWFAVALAVIGVAIALRRWRSWYGANACIVLTVLVYFVFLSNRWDAFRYVGFIVPLIYTLVVYGFVTLGRWLITRLRLTQRFTAVFVGVLSVGVIILAGPALSFPGIKSNTIVWVTSYGDRTHEEHGFPDMKTAYQYVIDHYQTDEVVLIQGTRFYYWSDPTIPVYKLNAYKRLPFDQFIALAQLGQNGGWFIYNAPNARHLRKDIMQYATDYFDYKNELQHTLVRVYHFTPEDLTHVPVPEETTKKLKKKKTSESAE